MSKKGFKSPNYTQIPNDFFDMLPELGDAEIRFLLVQFRHTFGYHREKFRMSLTNLQKASGLSRQGVINAAETSEKRGLVSKNKDGNVNEWLVNVVDQSAKKTGKVVNEVDQLVNPVDQTSQPSRPPSIKENIKENEIEKKIDPLIQKIISVIPPDLINRTGITDRLETATAKGYNNSKSGIIKISIPSSEDRDWLENRGRRYIEQALIGLGRDEKLEFVLEEIDG